MAAFSAFVRITPETQDIHNITVAIESIGIDTCKARVESKNLFSGRRSVWLITTSEPMPADQQNFRSFIWSAKARDSSILKKKELICKITERINTRSEYVEVILKRKDLTKTYIYVDYPQMIFDGGYYYCIDLWSYCQTKAPGANDDKGFDENF